MPHEPSTRNYARQQTHKIICPACERFIGPDNTCPYCDTDTNRPLSIRILRQAALLLAIPGLIIILVTAQHNEIPVIEINEITPMMNFAKVRITGIVEYKPYLARENEEIDYVSFLVSSHSGRLRVTAYNDVSRQLANMHLIPGKGDLIEAAGTLTVSTKNKITLRLQSADNLKILATNSLAK